jgi:hypothetical protein
MQEKTFSETDESQDIIEEYSDEILDLQEQVRNFDTFLYLVGHDEQIYELRSEAYKRIADLEISQHFIRGIRK